MKTLRGHLKSWAAGLAAVILTSLYPLHFYLCPKRWRG